MQYIEVIARIITGRDNHRLVYHSYLPLPIGTVVKIPLGQRRELGLVVKAAAKPPYPTKLAEPLIASPAPVQYVEFLLWLSRYYATPSPLVLKQLLTSGLQKTRRPLAKVLPPKFERPLTTLKLSQSQLAALKQIQSVDSTSILHGDTASGKTLIYRELAKAALSQQRSVLLLTPEIGLSQQLATDFQDLTEHIFVSHSELTEAQRHAIWLEILQHKPPIIVIGPRSALLTPIANLGLIIIDEAHENTYKNDTSPRYQAQTAAAVLGQLHKAKVVLGSATPRITDYYLAQQRKNAIVPLARFAAKAAAITVVDQRISEQFSRSSVISNELLSALETTLSQKRQSLLYLNRRGTATLVVCARCGWSDQCPRCDVNLSLHHDLGVALCHQCGYRHPVPVHCPSCGSADILFRGVGTKRLEREIAKLLPSARIVRFDGDSLKGQRLSDLYQSVHEGQVDIVIGTQSVAKGLDLPRLDTLGVVSADSELHLPDFMASERSFQLLYQVVGRVGRSGGGRAIIQTRHPDHPAIIFALARDYAGFYSRELALRRQHLYPPFRHLLALICKASSRSAAIKGSEEHAKLIKHQFRGIDIMGPAPAYVERQGRYYRWMIVIKSPVRGRLVEIAEMSKAKRAWQADLDPVNLLY